MRSLLAMLCVLLLAQFALADSLQISLPLQGYYRPGQYMPVRASGLSAEMVLTAIGAVPTRLEGGTQSEVVLPLLMVTPNATEVTARSNGEAVKSGPLRPLAEDERLVGVTEGNAAFAATLFPGKKIITIPIDPQFPNPAPYPIAWDALDAIVLDVFPKTMDPWTDAVLANGTIIAVKGNPPAQGGWTWEKRGEYSVIARRVYGPTGGEIDLQNYAPSYGLEPEESLATRQLVVIGGALFALLVIASSLLLRPRASVVVIAMLSIVTATLALLGHQQQEAKEVYHSPVEIFAMPVMQTDRWSYVRSWRGPSAASEGASNLIYPMLASESQIESLSLQLRCEYDGTPRTMDYTLPPHHTIAWLQRLMTSTSTGVGVEQGVTSRFKPVLTEKYLSSDLKELGTDMNGERGIVLTPK